MPAFYLFIRALEGHNIQNLSYLILKKGNFLAKKWRFNQNDILKGGLKKVDKPKTL